jgi:hypothetical protein
VLLDVLSRTVRAYKGQKLPAAVGMLLASGSVGPELTYGVELLVHTGLLACITPCVTGEYEEVSTVSV